MKPSPEGRGRKTLTGLTGLAYLKVDLSWEHQVLNGAEFELAHFPPLKTGGEMNISINYSQIIVWLIVGALAGSIAGVVVRRFAASQCLMYNRRSLWRDKPTVRGARSVSCGTRQSHE